MNNEKINKTIENLKDIFEGYLIYWQDDLIRKFDIIYLKKYGYYEAYINFRYDNEVTFSIYEKEDGYYISDNDIDYPLDERNLLFLLVEPLLNRLDYYREQEKEDK